VNAAIARSSTEGVLRHARDLPLVLAALVHAGVASALVAAAPRGVAVVPAVLALAVGIAWSSNTLAHVHLHQPLFRSRPASRAFSLLLTVTTLIPQTVWTQRHLAHHAGRPPRLRRTAALGGELLAIAATVAAIVALRPGALRVVLPGYLLGLAACRVQGDAEHSASIAGAAPVTAGVSHYGRLYNLLWFNDGYHAEHHRHPGRHWSELPALRCPDAVTSDLPPIVRPLGAVRGHLLGALERLVLRPSALQRFVLARHRQAFVAALEGLDRASLRRVAVVGGGIFPRSARLLRELLPDAELVVIDASEESLRLGRSMLPDAAVAWRAARWSPEDERDFDLVVLPLAFVGAPPRPARAVHLVHAWWTDRRGDRSVPVSFALFKRLSVLLPGSPR